MEEDISVDWSLDLLPPHVRTFVYKLDYSSIVPVIHRLCVSSLENLLVELLLDFIYMVSSPIHKTDCPSISSQENHDNNHINPRMFQ